MNIKKRIHENGWTVSKLAEELQMTQPTLSIIINGKNPSFESLQKIAKAIGISVSELVKEDNDQPTIICPHCGGSIVLQPQARTIKNNPKTSQK